ncbi:unnamed protein product [Candidula unifasciata]|uniref:PEST proteolytic signal-containing nuclear protein n=1 Tax=Candidula unifasciata TaxID=100452 RepID=A0A8S4A7X3_9EUPU|nr:unnamed protein product [Candidula unifasciata]
MADTYEGADSSPDDDGEVRAEKRRNTESSDSVAPAKKISMSFGTKSTPAAGQKISFNLSASSQVKTAKVSPLQSKPAKTTAAPIKMSLNQVQSKEPPPVVQKSALAAKAFDESDESDGEEMPPEAKMRMKNIGRDTPTASGPNSYGKGKQGFIDRQKIIEKQLKEEMEKVSGDNRRILPK